MRYVQLQGQILKCNLILLGVIQAIFAQILIGFVCKTFNNNARNIKNRPTRFIAFDQKKIIIPE